MDAVKFLEEWERMCDVTECTQCGAKYYCLYSDVSTPYKMGGAHNDFVKTVCDWSESHPRKTRLQDFLEKYPNATLNYDVTPIGVCCSLLGYCDVCRCAYTDKNCRECWNEPLEE